MYNQKDWIASVEKKDKKYKGDGVKAQEDRAKQKAASLRSVKDLHKKWQSDFGEGEEANATKVKDLLRHEGVCVVLTAFGALLTEQT